MKNIVLVIFVLSMLGSCTNNDQDEVMIRIENASDFDFKGIIVNSFDYGDLDSHQVSDFKSFELAYRYGSIELMIDGETFKWLPIDYVGETPLDSGRYTYVIDVNSSGGLYDRLTLNLVVD